MNEKPPDADVKEEQQRKTQQTNAERRGNFQLPNERVLESKRLLSCMLQNAYCNCAYALFPILKTPQNMRLSALLCCMSYKLFVNVHVETFSLYVQVVCGQGLMRTSTKINTNKDF